MFFSKVLLIPVLVVVIFSVNSLARPEEEQEAPKGVNAADDPAALEKTSAEAIGERIMEEMNSMKEKFDTALNKIGEEITKNEKEQDETKMKE